MKKNKGNALGIFSGIISIILGIVSFCLDNGYGVYSKSYGGDAYTGIQNAAAATANNVQSLCDVVKFGFGALLIVIGLAIIAFFLSKLLSAAGDKSDKTSDPIEENNKKLLNTGESVPDDPIEALNMYKRLLDTGEITLEEFKAIKKELIGL